MDASQLSRWTRFAKKGGIGKCVALQHCVAEQPGDLMFFKDDEITVLMQIPDEDGVYLGYCEGVVGRFAATYVQFIGKLKTPVIAKRSSTSKSPRPRSLTPSRRQQPSQPGSPAPSPSRADFHEEDVLHVSSSSSAPSVPNPLPNDHWHLHSSETSPRTHASAEPSHHDSLVTPSMSHSSSSSAHESASPPTPSESFAEPPLRDKTGPSVVSEPSHNAEHGQNLLPSAFQPKLDTPETPPSSMPTSGPTFDSQGPARAGSQSSDTPIADHSLRPPSPQKMELSGSHLGVGDADSVRLSRHPDGAAGIGLSMLQGFLSGDVDDNEDDEDEDEDEDGDNSDHEFSSQSERERTSLEETVDGFPAPPTQIPTPSSRATSFVLDALRPSSSVSEYSEDGDGASFYDNYRYSRLSISSKMSKSSGYTVATVPPPVPTEPPPQVRHSQDSQYSAPALPSEPLSPPPETSVFSPPREATPPMVVQAIRNIPPPLTLKSNPLGSEPSNLVTAAVTSPLLHTNFSSPQSSPPDPNTSSTVTLSPVATLLDLQGSGAASALRQRIEADHGKGSPLISPVSSTKSDGRMFEELQSIVVRDDEDIPRSQPQSPTSPAASPISMGPQKKSRGGPAPLVVMNPTPPPPYTTRSPQVSSPSQKFAVMPTSAAPHSPLRALAEPAVDPSPTSVFLPHPNAPKPNLSPESPLCWRPMPRVQPPPSTLLVKVMYRAAQMRVAPNGLPRFSTIYGSTIQDLASAVGPVLIIFSVDPPNDIPANRMRMAPAAVPTPGFVPASISAPTKLSPAPGELRPPAARQGATTDVIPRPGFVPKAGVARPRSRSFSGFDSPIGPGTLPKEQSREATNSRPSTAESAPNSRTNPLTARAAAHTARIHQARQYTPSPLALSQTSARGSTQALTSSASSPAHPTSSPTSPTLRRKLTPVKSEPSLRSGPPRATQEREGPSQSPAKPDEAGSSRVPFSTSSPALKGSPPSIQISASESQLLSNRFAQGNEVMFSRQLSVGSLRRRSSDVGRSTRGDARPQVSSHPQAPTSSAPLGRSGSLRSKISLSALRAKSSRDDEGLYEADTVQVKDTDFELIRPNPTRLRLSEDSAANSKSSGSEGRPSFLRVDSPAMSSTSGGASDTRSPVSPSAMSLSPVAGTSAPVGMGSVEAHRARELKWVTLMSSTPPSQARKSKKIRKLLQEGVPASVRYQVWAHLTDSKAKRIEGLYVQLGGREKVPAFANIQRDAALCFPNDVLLSQPNGPLVSLLQAYLTMVPDIQYSKGLAFIAGQLLLQSPEEDAFWIFISLMDSHLRTYFSSSSVQLDVDASLFAKSVEAIDSTIAKKLFVEMAIPPIRVCRPWFSTLFVEALPAHYFQRVWDIFLSEGVVFLFRVGLAIVTCCHRTLLGVQQEAEVLNLLTRPPPFLISSSPDLFIELANSFRLRDDEIRKQRVKLEAQVKLQSHGRLSNAARRSSSNVHGGTTASISLPRT